MTVPFDHYQRYKTLSNIVEEIKEQYTLTSFKILEIGANVQRNLEKFLINDDIYYSDIELPQELQNNSHFFIADATNLVGISDDEYDIVLAADVFEHIPNAKREDFIKEINRVAKYAAIICFPFLSDHNVEAEKHIDNYFMTISGEHYLWLKEHIENGLPDKEKLDGILDHLNLHYVHFEHGDIKTWELMMKNHMFTSIAQDLIKYREQMDDYYDEHLYSADVTNQNYRTFYVMYKDADRETIINKAINSLNFTKSNHNEINHRLLDFSQDIKDINELKLRLKVNENSSKSLGYNGFNQTRLVDNAFGIYFNYGDGYSEENKVTSKDVNIVNIEGNRVGVKIPDNVLKVRIDPLEGMKCILFNLVLISNGNSTTNYKTNSISSGKYLIFDTVDPWIELDIIGKNAKIEIYADIILLDNMIINLAIEELNTFYSEKCNKLNTEKQLFLVDVETYQKESEKLSTEKQLLLDEYKRISAEKQSLLDEYESLSVEKQSLLDEIEKLSTEKLSLLDEFDKLNREEQALTIEAEAINNQNILLNDKNIKLCDNVAKLNSDNLILAHEADAFKGMFNSITNSFFWKITKPFRWITDLLKRALKKNKVTYRICRWLLYCKQHGFKYWLKQHNAIKQNNGTIIQQENAVLPVIHENIKFSILVPIYNPKCEHLKACIDSVIAQNYTNWELCLADGSNKNIKLIRSVCEEYANSDVRIKYRALDNNWGISGNTNECAKMASGNYYVLCDQDDLIYSQALYYNAVAIAETDAEVLYSDEDHVTESGQHTNVIYKPDWSIDLLYNQMYICHLFVFKKALFEQVGGFRKEFDGSQDYDLMLRFSEITDNICHISRVLYSWRETESSTALNADSKPYAHYAGKNALDNHLKRKYGEIAHAEVTEYLFLYEARFDLLESNNKVSIIIPMKDNYKLTDNCIQSILSLSTFSNYEILIINNRSEEKATYNWLKTIPDADTRIRVIYADFEFNWSKINNFAVSHATGDIYVFLNNDTLVITPDWIERLCELTLREDVGIVGPMLLYEDNTIQHAGVVVGIGGWAEHIFKGMQPVHYGTPFVSPSVNRNVLAVTGACMCISREKFEKIGGFDEEFIICGSDVELGIRAYKMGYNNIYDAHVRLYHLESKSRDSYIPEIDFKKSYECYTQFREDGDPYYNGNLDINSAQPKESGVMMDLNKIKKHLRFNRITAPIYKKVRNAIIENSVTYEIPEVLNIGYREADRANDVLRLNILVPSVNKEHVFGGISTALKFYEKLGDELKCDMRIIITDSAYDAKNAVDLAGYVLCEADKDIEQKKQLVPFGDRYNKTIPIRKRDIFIATGWWTAYTIAETIRWQNNTYKSDNALIYFIQDFEPGFYPWSSRYLMADSTYKLDIPTIAIFNSKLLMEHFNKNNYKFSKEYYFEPTLNEILHKYLVANKDKYKRKNSILIYGRPSVQRNAFELIVNSLAKWSIEYQKSNEWEIISLGEQFTDIDLSNKLKIKSYGKVSLEEYAKIMLEAKIGISLMVSPHPSYPPLEMSTFGIKTITNCYEHKDLTSFNENIVSLSDCSQTAIVNTLIQLCNDKSNNVLCDSNEYFKNANTTEKICCDLAKIIL